MASPSLALPGVLFVGEDERARLVAHLGPAAGWMIPRGVLGWSHEVSVVARDALNENVRRDTKIVMPEEQIPAAKLPLTHQAALKSPIVAISGKLTTKLVESGIRVHTIGADRVTSSFYYIAEGGGEPNVRIEGDLVAAVGAMLGDRADNAAIERVLDGIVDRLVRSLSKDRVTELSLELAAALPRAAADGTGTQDIDLEAFEKELTALIGASEKYTPFLQEIAARITNSTDRKVDIPLFGDARKISQGPFDLEVGTAKVALVTHERWLATGPLSEPTRAAPEPAAVAAPAPKSEPKPVAESKPAPKSEPQPQAKVEAKPAPKSEPRPTTPKPTPTTPKPAPAAASPSPAPANIKPLAAPLNPPRPGSTPPPQSKPDVGRITPAPVQIVQGDTNPAAPAAPPSEPAKKTDPVAAKAAEPAKVEAATVEPPMLVETPKEPKATKAAAAAKAETTKDPKVVPPSPEPAAVRTKSKDADAPAKKGELARDESRLATTQKVPRPEKGLPWIWIALLALAALFAAYRIWNARH